MPCPKTEYSTGIWIPREERNWAWLLRLILSINVTNQISKTRMYKRNEWASWITTCWLSALGSSREGTEILFCLDEQFHLIIAQERRLPLTGKTSDVYRHTVCYSNPLPLFTYNLEYLESSCKSWLWFEFERSLSFLYEGLYVSNAPYIYSFQCGDG